MIPLNETVIFKYLTFGVRTVTCARPLGRLQVRGKMLRVIPNQRRADTQSLRFDVSPRSSIARFHITRSDPSHQDRRAVRLLKAPQFRSSLHADLIIHKASNYTSIKPANTKTGINTSVAWIRFISENIHNLGESKHVPKIMVD